MALIFWRDRVLRGIFRASSVVFGTVVLLAHLHYTIAVAAAFLIAHSVFRIVGRHFDDPPSGFGALLLRQHSVEVRAQGVPQGRSGPAACRGVVHSPFFAALHWDLETVARQTEVRALSAPCSARYPVKLFRYWFMYNLIRSEAGRLGRPLRVCEIGTDRGQMLGFVRAAGNIAVERWDAVDYRLKPELNNFGYTRQTEVDVETDGFGLDETYDVVVVLHLLEHLLEPEKLLKRLSLHLQRGGIVVGGFPVTPQWAAPAWEKRLRRKIKRSQDNYGHVSVFSPQRVRAMSGDNGFNLEFLSGAFLIRKTGAAIENSSLWARLNLLWGATMPSLGGEIYWQMRRN